MSEQWSPCRGKALLTERGTRKLPGMIEKLHLDQVCMYIKIQQAIHFTFVYFMHSTVFRILISRNIKKKWVSRVRVFKKTQKYLT